MKIILRDFFGCLGLKFSSKVQFFSKYHNLKKYVQHAAVRFCKVITFCVFTKPTSM